MEEVRQYPLWKEAVKTFLLANFQPGHVITEKWKREHFGITPPKTGTMEQLSEYQLKLLSAWENFSRTLLEEHQIHFRANGARSHIVLAPREQAGVAMSDCNREIKRTLKKAKLRTENIALELLTNDERREVTDAQVRIAMQASMFKQVKRLSLTTS